MHNSYPNILVLSSGGSPSALGERYKAAPLPKITIQLRPLHIPAFKFARSRIRYRTDSRVLSKITTYVRTTFTARSPRTYVWAGPFRNGDVQTKRGFAGTSRPSHTSLCTCIYPSCTTPIVLSGVRTPTDHRRIG